MRFKTSRPQKTSYTKVFIEEWNGYPILGIWETDHKGDKKWEKPLISFGLNKAQAILNHQEEINSFLQENQSLKNSK